MRLFLIILLFPLLLSGCKEDNKSSLITAEAILYFNSLQEDGTYASSSTIYGTAQLKEENGIVEITITTESQMDNDQHAVHIHQGNCEIPGVHWNMNSQDNFCSVDNNGTPWARPKAGDIGNIQQQSNGKGSLIFSSSLWSLKKNHTNSILGLPIIVHESGEDFAQECFENHTHMHNNAKIACGSIELTND